MDRLSISSWPGSWFQLVPVGSSKYPELVRVGSNGASNYLELAGEFF
jgi:hypothetical protein